MTTVPSPVATSVVYQQGSPQVSLNVQAALIIGYIQIAISVVSVGFGIAGACLPIMQGVIAIPIWGALLFYLVAGILAVVAGKTNGQNSNVVVGCLVMSILAAVTAGVHVVVGSVSSAVHMNFRDRTEAEIAMNIVITLIGLLEMVAAIIASAFMCQATKGCCCDVSSMEKYASYVPEEQAQQNVGTPQEKSQMPADSENEKKEVPP